MSKYSEYDTTNMISFNFTALEATLDNPGQRLLDAIPTHLEFTNERLLMELMNNNPLDKTTFQLLIITSTHIQAKITKHLIESIQRVEISIKDKKK